MTDEQIEQTYDWLAVLADLAEKRVPCVLMTVTEAKGSTPREAGTKMVVTATEQFCTIGGGNLEFQAIEEARQLLAEAVTAPAIKDYPLGPKLAQCCGGAVSVMLEPFIPNTRKLYLFGAGHVGKEVVKVLAGLPIDIHWVDERADEFPAQLPKNCQKIISATPAAVMRDMTDDAYILVMTHSHDLDYDIVQAAMKSGSYAYLGLIGSATKRARFEKRLQLDGIAATDLSRLTCPIGLAAVKGKHPREIAIGVAAELLACGLTGQKAFAAAS
jgi:xanthine dehydrogenase accessory factor